MTTENLSISDAIVIMEQYVALLSAESWLTKDFGSSDEVARDTVRQLRAAAGEDLVSYVLLGYIICQTIPPVYDTISVRGTAEVMLATAKAVLRTLIQDREETKMMVSGFLGGPTGAAEA